MPLYQNWMLTTEDRIVTLTLNRAHAMNSLTPETLVELREIAHTLRDDKGVWAIILQSAGDHFSVGVDVSAIGQMVGQQEAAYRANLRNLQDCLDTFESLPMPTIAKIRGYCIGGALLLTLCCDFRVAEETARFSLPEVERGIAVIMGTQRITKIAGPAATKEMVMLAQRFDAKKAESYGLLTQLVSPSELDTTVNQLADRFRQLPPRTISVAKRIIDEGATMTLRESQNLEIDLQYDLLNSADFAEAVQAFFEKRKPQFKGE